MKTFLFVLLGALLFCAVMWFTVTHYPDGAGRWTGLGVAVVLFAVCAFGPGRLWGKSNRLNSFALPLLLSLTYTFSPWHVLVVLVIVVWVWALTRKEDGNGYLNGLNTVLAVLAACVFTVAAGIGALIGHYAK